jgi:hypothetical protein
MSNLELNINEYEYKDLLGLFGINNEYLDNIQEKYRVKMTKVEQMENNTLKKNIESFLNKAYITIINKINEENNISRIPENPTTSHNIIEVEEPRKTSTFPLKYPLGNINQIERKTTTQLISIDSIFRDLTLYPKSTDFVINLPNPIENVISMKLIAAEIPNSFPLYSETQGNNKLIITMTTDGGYLDPLTIVLIDGSPSFSTLIKYINNILDAQRNEYSYLKCGVDNISGKFFFRFKTLNEMFAWSIRYYSIDGTINPPDNKPPTKNTIMNFNRGYTDISNNYDNTTFQHNAWDMSLNNIKYNIDFNPNKQQLIKSLGWALGFREPVTDLIGINNTLKRGYIEYNGYLESNKPYSDAECDYSFLYINDFVGNYNDNLSASLNDNHFFSKSLMARMKISSNFYSVDFHEASINILEKTREYFGPVNIKKLHIKLIDKFGILGNLNNSNYSLTLQFEKLYSSIRN